MTENSPFIMGFEQATFDYVVVHMFRSCTWTTLSTRGRHFDRWPQRH